MVVMCRGPAAKGTKKTSHGKAVYDLPDVPSFCHLLTDGWCIDRNLRRFGYLPLSGPQSAAFTQQRRTSHTGQIQEYWIRKQPRWCIPTISASGRQNIEK